jgi:trehalose 6-phosphate synthase/phosphatase
MFRALLLFQATGSEAVLHPSETTESLIPISFAVQPEGIFATTVGASTKKTLASWHVTGPQEIINTVSLLVTGH